MVRSSKTPAFWSVACPIRRRFRVFRGAIMKIHGFELPFPTFAGNPDEVLSSFKSFCSAPLERRSNCWSEALKKFRASSTVRFSIFHSLFLFRKLVPGNKPSLIPLFLKVTQPAHEPDQKFMDFIRSELPRILPPGWDRTYSQHCLNVTIPTKNCFESRITGKCSRSLLIDPFEDGGARESFVSDVLATYQLSGRVKARLACVLTGGKWRNLSIPSVEMNHLRPLHSTLYDYISRYDWLLRGEEKAKVFKDFGYREGEVFVSGDYESATDNLNPYIQQEILRLVLQNARYTPNEIKRLAFSSLSLDIENPDPKNQGKFSRQCNGQMMGNLMSFPLLCLVNYLTFRFSVRDRSVPVKINGDDIVFRSRLDIAQKWMDQVKLSGLVLSKGKTLVDRRFFTLNSSLFRSRKDGCVLVPFIRSKALFGVDDESPLSSVGGRFLKFCPGYYGRRRVLLRAIYLRENSGYINQSKRSLSRGLGIPVRPAELKESGLWARELRYLELPSERKIPPTFSEWKEAPTGFELCWVDKEYKRSSEDDERLRAAFIEATWRSPSERTHKEYREAYFGGLNLNDRVFLAKRHRLEERSRLLSTRRWSDSVRPRDAHAFTRSWLRANSDHLWGKTYNGLYRKEWLPIERDRFLISEDGLAYPLDCQYRKLQPVSEELVTEENFCDVREGIESFLYPPPY